MFSASCAPAYSLNPSLRNTEKEESSSGNSSQSLEEESDASLDEEAYDKLGITKPNQNSDSDSDLDEEEKKHIATVTKNFVSKNKRLTEVDSDSLDFLDLL